MEVIMFILIKCFYGCSMGQTYGHFAEDVDPLWDKPKVVRSNDDCEFVKDDEVFSKIGLINFNDDQFVITINDNIDLANVDINELIEAHTEKDKKYFQLQQKLVKNYFFSNKLGLVRWLRS